jgi:hypothetical protein
VAPAKQASRLLSIAADLLPPEIVGSRRTRKVRRLVLSALAAFAVLLAGWYGTAGYQTSLARDDLYRAQTAADRLSRQQKPFAELLGAQAESRAIGAELSALLAGDLQWSRLLSSVRQAAPAGIQLGSVTGGLDSATAGGSATSQLPNTSGQKVVGALTVTGSAPGKAAVAGYIDALAQVPGLASPLLDNVIEQNGAVRFTIRVTITGSALGGRYTTPTGNETKGR